MIFPVLKDYAPVAMATAELSLVLVDEFQLEFATEREMKAWLHNSVGNALKNLVIAGRIERLHDPKVRWGGADGKWRLNACAEKPLESIRAVADGFGVGVQQAKRRGRPVKSKKTVDEEVMEGA